MPVTTEARATMEAAAEMYAIGCAIADVSRRLDRLAHRVPGDVLDALNAIPGLDLIDAAPGEALIALADRFVERVS